MWPPHIRIYTECLSGLGYGTPLWSPKPLQLLIRDGNEQRVESKEAMLGDVGFITDTGSWKSMFNVFDETDLPQGVDTRSIRFDATHLSPQVYGVFNARRMDAGFQIGSKEMYVYPVICLD